MEKTDTREEGEDWDSTDRENELALKLAGFARLAKILSLSNVVAITLFVRRGKEVRSLRSFAKFASLLSPRTIAARERERGMRIVLL